MSRRVGLLVLACSTLAPQVARAAGLPPCTQAIASATEKYAVSKRKAIAGCEDKRASGKLAPSVNCRPSLGAVTDLGTDKKLTKLASKVEPTISGKCTGPLPPLGPACDSATTVHDLALCITAPVQDADVENISVDTLIDTLYDTAPPITDTPLRKCEAAISKAGGKYLAARLKAKRKCAPAVGAGKAPGPCPDADTAADIEKARMTFQVAIQNACTETQLAADSPPALTFAPHAGLTS